MKKKFSKHWKSSKKPRKQRKYRANAPLHLRKKFVNANLSKTLRKKHNKRSVAIRKGDKVKVMRGKFKGKSGKVNKVKMKYGKIIVDGIQVTKQDGSKSDVSLKPSNLQIIELDTADKKRFSTKSKEDSKKKGESKKKKTKTKKSKKSKKKSKGKKKKTNKQSKKSKNKEKKK